jgi:hypothetical protein
LSQAPLSPTDRRRNLIAVTAAMTATSLIYGLSVPLLSLVLEDRDVDGTLIGTQTAVQSAAIFLISPLLPRHMQRTGPADPDAECDPALDRRVRDARVLLEHGSVVRAAVRDRRCR